MTILIVGELINTSRRAVKEAVEARDADYIKKLAKMQVDAGANYVDVNCGTLVNNEPETMAWLVDTIQSYINHPLCIDSPDPKTLEAGLSICKNGQSMINSISAEKERYEAVLPLVLKYRAKIVSLCMDDTGMPTATDDRLRISDKLIGGMVSNGVPEDDIYVDPLVKPISTNDKAGIEVLDAVSEIRRKYPKVHGICGLSNVSFGLPNRKILNQIFMIQMMARGMDSYILDPLDKTMMGFVYGSTALLGMDEFSMQYLTAHRNGLYDK